MMEQLEDLHTFKMLEYKVRDKHPVKCFNKENRV